MLHRRADAFLRVLALAAICASHIRRRQPSTISDGPQSRSAVAPPLVHTNHTTTLQCHFTAAERAQRHRNWITRAPRDKTPSTPLPNICLYTYNICNVRDTLTIDKMAHHAFARQAREAHTHRDYIFTRTPIVYIDKCAYAREKWSSTKQRWTWCGNHGRRRRHGSYRWCNDRSRFVHIYYTHAHNKCIPQDAYARRRNLARGVSGRGCDWEHRRVALGDAKATYRQHIQFRPHYDDQEDAWRH